MCFDCQTKSYDDNDDSNGDEKVIYMLLNLDKEEKEVKMMNYVYKLHTKLNILIQCTIKTLVCFSFLCFYFVGYLYAPVLI